MKQIRLAMDAIENDDIQTLRQIVSTAEQANWRLPECPKWDLLLHAVSCQNTRAVEYLLETGANPDVVFCGCELIQDYDCLVEDHYKSALMLAINLGKDYLVSLLIDHGASPEIPISVYSNGMRETCADRIQESGSKAMRAAVERWRLLEESDDDEYWDDGETKRL